MEKAVREQKDKLPRYDEKVGECQVTSKKVAEPRGKAYDVAENRTACARIINGCKNSTPI